MNAFGESIGLSKGRVTQVEDGTAKSIGLRAAFKIQDLTGYSARWVVLGEGPKKLSESAQLAEKILSLPESERELLIRIFAAAVSDSKLGKEWSHEDGNDNSD